MIELSHPWPFEITPRNWPWFALGFVVLIGALAPFDHSLSVYATGQSSEVHHFFSGFTRWGSSEWILIPAFGLLVICGALIVVVRQRTLKLAVLEVSRIVAFIFLGIGVPTLGAYIFKRALGRCRPPAFDLSGAFAFHPFANSYLCQGFPSGHATTAFAGAMVLGFLAPRWYGLALLGAIGIAVSRVVTAAHYPTDVVAGAFFGALGAYAVRWFFARRRWGFVRRADGHIVLRDLVALSKLTAKKTRSQPGSDK